jgi:hypothetical protein
MGTTGYALRTCPPVCVRHLHTGHGIGLSESHACKKKCSPLVAFVYPERGNLAPLEKHGQDFTFARVDNDWEEADRLP